MSFTQIFMNQFKQRQFNKMSAISPINHFTRMSFAFIITYSLFKKGFYSKYSLKIILKIEHKFIPMFSTNLLYINT